MKSSRWIFLFLIIIFGCNQETPTVAPSPTFLPTKTPTLTLPTMFTTQVPEVRTAARAYLDAWVAEEYSDMYGLLTSLSKDAIDEDDFTTQYRTVTIQAAIDKLSYKILSTFTQPRSAQVAYRVIMDSILVGEIQRDTLMNLSLEGGEWHIQWDDALILPELRGGNYMRMSRRIPSRGNIYDREGRAIAAYTEATSIGLIPGQIDPELEADLLNELQWLTGLHPNAIAAMYADFPPASDWYLPLGEATLEKVQQRYNLQNGYNLNGLLMVPYDSRFYFENGIAPQAIGYVSLIQEGEADDYLRQGYQIDEKVGRQGIERWGEAYLGGTRGGTLHIVDGEGIILYQLADVPAQPAQSIYTTLDRDLQKGAQIALQGFRGAVVVLEIDTGRVLVMASSPHFDPNVFEPANRNSVQLGELFGQDSQFPFLNRASQGQYPLGSVFKIVTMAAALESGLYSAQSTYQCGYFFEEIQGHRPYDWTYDHFLEDGTTPPSGLLTLPEGLMRSCNPFFWHMGLDLYEQGLTTAISDMARGFGFGNRTGILGVEEEPGNIPEPQNEVDAINLAIGQGDTLVTPLQIAQLTAAIGNGGTLYQPQIIEAIIPPSGEPTYSFEPVVIRNLPVSTETLEIIREAMIDVVENPRGTAQHVLAGYSLNYFPLAGKTGTAESGFGEPHAWFVGYTRSGREDKADIAIAVIAENAGEGSDIAAPIFKGIVQLYFEGGRHSFPWESAPGIWKVPEPEETETEE